MASILDGIITEGAIGQHHSFQQAHKTSYLSFGRNKKRMVISSTGRKQNPTIFLQWHLSVLPAQHHPPSLSKSALIFFCESLLSYSLLSCGSGGVDATAWPEGQPQDLSLTKPDIPFPWPWWSVLSCWPIGVNSGTLARIDGKECPLPVGDISQELQVAVVILSLEELACK